MSCLLAEHMPYKGKVRAARQTGIGEGLGARFQIVRSMLHSQPFPDPMLRLFLPCSSPYDCCAIIQLVMEGCEVSNGGGGDTNNPEKINIVGTHSSTVGKSYCLQKIQIFEERQSLLH